MPSRARASPPDAVADGRHEIERSTDSALRVRHHDEDPLAADGHVGAPPAPGSRTVGVA